METACTEAQGRNRRVWLGLPFSHLSGWAFTWLLPEVSIKFLLGYWHACHCTAQDKAFLSQGPCFPVYRMWEHLWGAFSCSDYKNCSSFSILPLNLPQEGALATARPLPAQCQHCLGFPSFSFIFCSPHGLLFPALFLHHSQLPCLCAFLPHPPWKNQQYPNHSPSLILKLVFWVPWAKSHHAHYL